jgi:hypothetical protein
LKTLWEKSRPEIAQNSNPYGFDNYLLNSTLFPVTAKKSGNTTLVGTLYKVRVYIAKATQYGYADIGSNW